MHNINYIDMKTTEKTGMLKIYLGESDRIQGRPLYEKIIFEAREAGLAGATVYKGMMSFGASHSINTIKIFALSSEMPIIIEIVDNTEKLDEFAQRLNELMDHSKKGSLITFQEIDVVRYQTGEKYRK